jgi:hypothetical protein
MKFFRTEVNVIIHLDIVIKLAWPKVITLSGVYCTVIIAIRPFFKPVRFKANFKSGVKSIKRFGAYSLELDSLENI